MTSCKNNQDLIHPRIHSQYWMEKYTFILLSHPNMYLQSQIIVTLQYDLPTYHLSTYALPTYVLTYHLPTYYLPIYEDNFFDLPIVYISRYECSKTQVGRHVYLPIYLIRYIIILPMKKMKVQMLFYTLTKKFMEVQGYMLNSFGIIFY